MTGPLDLLGDFPILARKVNGKPLCYLDSASSAQKPRAVLDAVMSAYAEDYSNVHRGLHHLSAVMTERYESVRGIVADFLNAEEDEVIFTSGATEGINLVSAAWAAPRLGPGDEIVLSAAEHHANIVPWHFLRERQGVVLKWVDFEPDGTLDPQAVIDAIGPRTRLVAVTQMSNVLGVEVDLAAICAGAQARGVPVLVDGAQGAVHAPVDVQAIGCDFYALAGHKLYGPSGSGALWVRRARAAEMQPYRGGGDMIREVTREAVTYAAPPLRFEAGTPAIVAQIGLGAALGYLGGIGMARIRAHERDLVAHARAELAKVPGIELFGMAPGKGPLFSFRLQRAGSPQRLAALLDQEGIAIRAGSFCSQPLMAALGVKALCRASLGLYTTRADIDRLCAALRAL
ncbi:aminotransferase class V-fold PLP-dependent enzyme [Paracoccus aminovorans]|uniref:aminotransferase class V-fold PLP-dependent enzyme n=1 Tax=Paracoccus aminovorans TaxID=34004 RepID=UPI0007862916|nr:cysteine desulfurase [Paracoccus aminovorans]MDQ7777003.1 cysteine desulfurase [Paracoccus aminovorans]